MDSRKDSVTEKHLDLAISTWKEKHLDFHSVMPKETRLARAIQMRMETLRAIHLEKRTDCQKDSRLDLQMGTGNQP
jgi:hypothetical protein